MNIYSWICDTCLIPVNEHAEEAASKAVQEQKEEREAWEQAQKSGEDPEAAAGDGTGVERKGYQVHNLNGIRNPYLLCISIHAEVL